MTITTGDMQRSLSIIGFCFLDRRDMFLLNIVQYSNDHIDWRNATQSIHHWFLLPDRRDMFQLNIVQYSNDHSTGVMQRSLSIIGFCFLIDVTCFY